MLGCVCASGSEVTRTSVPNGGSVGPGPPLWGAGPGLPPVVPVPSVVTETGVNSRGCTSRLRGERGIDPPLANCPPSPPGRARDPEPLSAGETSTRTAAIPTTANSRANALPNPPLIDDIETFLPGEDRSRFLPQSDAEASISRYLSTFQFGGSVVEVSRSHSPHRPHARRMRSEAAHGAEAPPVRASRRNSSIEVLAPRVRRAPPHRGACPVPARPRRGGGPWPRRRRQLLEGRARSGDPPPSLPSASLSPRGEPRELREAVPPLQRGGCRGCAGDLRHRFAGGRNP